MTHTAITDLPMEIQMAFYPPPTVIVPELNIPKLRKYEYNFDRERAAILKYEHANQLKIEQSQRRAETEELKRRAESAKSQREQFEVVTAVASVPSTAASSSCVSSSQSAHPKLAQPQQLQLLTAAAAPKTTGAAIVNRTTATSSKPAATIAPAETAARTTILMSGLEQFEVQKDAFDLVELRSLDDRRELEKLLMGMHLSAAAATNGHQQQQQG